MCFKGPRAVCINDFHEVSDINTMIDLYVNMSDTQNDKSLKLNYIPNTKSYSQMCNVTII